MTTGATGQLGLALPVQGELSGTWGDTVNNGITQYTNIAIAGTLTLTGDGAVTLANTTGDASASNITSNLSGAGTVTAQFAIVRVSGTTTTKVITGPSYSKTYVVDNASSYAVTFKASGQTGVSIAAAEKVTVVFNGTDYIKIAGTIANAAGSNTQIQFNNGGLFGASANLTWDGTTLSSTQINITGQGTLRLQDTTGGEYVAHRAPSALGASYTLTWPADDGTSGQALVTDGSGVLSWSTAASGDVYGPASSTDNAVARFDGTTGKLIQDSVVLIGDTGAVTGVTDLTASGSVTLSGGTANGVLYLNGSKVLTSGSALTFDGTGKLGVGTTTPVSGVSAGFEAVGEIWATTASSNANQIRLSPATSGANIIYSTYSGSGSYLPLAFNVSGSEQMRLTSTGLGIGTSSPGAKLDIGGGGQIYFSSSTAGNLLSNNAYVNIGQLYSSGGPYIGYGAKADPSNASAYVSATTVGIGRAALDLGSGGTGVFRVFTGSAETTAVGSPLVNMVERARIDSSGNFGIGTSSPNRKLEVASSTAALIRITSSAASGTGYVANEFYNGAGFGYCGTESSTAGTLFVGTTAYATILGNTAAYPIQFATNNTVRATLDSAGNLGLGVTPSAWSGWGNSIFQLSGAGTIISSTENSYLGSNFYYNSGYKYIANGASAYYLQNAGTHKWFNAASGTAGDAISFTQAMTLNASGFLGIGQTNPISYLDIYGNGAYTYARFYRSDEAGYGGRVGTGNTLLGAAVARSLGLDGYAGISFGIAGSQVATIDSSGNLLVGGTSAFSADTGRGNISINGASTSILALGVAASQAGYLFHDGTNMNLFNDKNGYLRFATNGTERARFTNGGQFLVGNTAGASYKVIFENSGQPILALNSTDSLGGYTAFQRNGTAYGYIGSAGPVATGGANTDIALRSENNLLFTSGGALERARIDSSGNLLVGKTSTDIGTVGVLITYYGAVTFSTATADYSIFNKTTTTTGKQIEFRSANTAVGYIESTSTATSYNTSSDYRLKNTIAPMTGALAKVAQLKPVTYKWNADGSDGEGFIAHELAEVCPHAVSGEKDAVDEEGNPKYQGIDTSFLVATLTAAIQEQQAIIESLKARLDAANL